MTTSCITGRFLQTKRERLDGPHPPSRYLAEPLQKPIDSREEPMTSIPNSHGCNSIHLREYRSIDLDGPPTITFQIDGQQIELTLAQIRSQEYVAGLQAQASTASHCMIDASAILGIDQESRIAVLQQLSLLTQQSRSALVSFSPGGQSPNLFQAGLLLLEQQGAPMITRVTDLLVEIAAITESDSGIPCGGRISA